MIFLRKFNFAILPLLCVLQSCEKSDTKDPDKEKKQETEVQVTCPVWEQGFQSQWLFSKGELWDTSKAVACSQLPEYIQRDDVSPNATYTRMLATTQPRIRHIQFKRGSADSLIYLVFTPDKDAEFPWEGKQELWHGNIKTGEYFKIDDEIGHGEKYYNHFFMTYSSSLVAYDKDFIYDIDNKNIKAELSKDVDAYDYNIIPSPSGKHYLEISFFDQRNYRIIEIESGKIDSFESYGYNESWVSDSAIMYQHGDDLWVINPFNDHKEIYIEDVADNFVLEYPQFGNNCDVIASNFNARPQVFDVSANSCQLLNSEFLYGKHCETIFFEHICLLPNQEFLVRLNEVEILPEDEQLLYHEKWLLFNKDLDKFREVKLKLPMQ